MADCNYTINGRSLSDEELTELQNEAVMRLSQQRQVNLNIPPVNIDDVISNLQSRGFINRTLFKGKYLRVPRGRDASDKIELQSLNEIQRANDRIKQTYGITEDVIVTVPSSNAGYNIEINNNAITDANEALRKAQTEPISQEMINDMTVEIMFERPQNHGYVSHDPSMGGDDVSPLYKKVLKIINYKKSLKQTLENQLATVESKIKNSSPSDKGYEELLRFRSEVNLRLKGNGSQVTDENYESNLNDEIKALETKKSEPAPSRIKALDFLYVDLNRVDRLLKNYENNPMTERSFNSLTEASMILSLFNAYRQSYGIEIAGTSSNPLFTEGELKNLKSKTPLASLKNIQQKMDDMMSKAQEQDLFDRLITAEKDLVTAVVNNDERVKNLFSPKKDFNYEQLFGQPQKDITKYDAWMMDGILATFSEASPVLQVMKNILNKNITHFDSMYNQWNEQLTKKQNSVQNSLRKLGYGLGPGGRAGASFRIFRQEDKDGNLTVNLVSRESAEYGEAKRKHDDAFWRIMGSSSATSFGQKQTAYGRRNNWLRKNSIMVDSRKLTEISEDPEFEQFEEYFNRDGGEHSQQLKTNLKSESGYNEIIEQQKSLLRDYMAEKRRFVNDLLYESDVTSVSELNIEQKKRLQIFEANNNPFIVMKAFSTGKAIRINQIQQTPLVDKYNVFIPRRFKPAPSNELETKKNSRGEIIIDETTEETGYYDKNYETIENDAALKDFYDLTKDILESSYKMLGPRLQQELMDTMFLGIRKTMGEILLDPHTPFLKRFVPAFKTMIDSLQSHFQVNVELSEEKGIINPFTNVVQPEVQTKFVKTNKREIDSRFKIASARFINSLSDQSRNHLRNRDGSIKMTRKSAISLSAVSQEGKELLAAWLGAKDSTDLAIMYKLDMKHADELVSVGRIIDKFVTSQVAADETFNLPKMLKLYAKGATTYAARNAAMPYLNIIKSHYMEIPLAQQTNTGKNKTRTTTDTEGDESVDTITDSELRRANANATITKWFKRNVLSQTKPTVYGVSESKSKPRVRLKSHERIVYDEAQKEIDKQLALPEEERNTEMIGDLKRLQENLGNNYAGSAMVDVLFELTRFGGLAVNAGAGVTNYVAGKQSNYINGVLGLYYTEDSLWRAERIIGFSPAKMIAEGFNADKILPHQRKAAILMSRYSVFQDASDEIYKSSIDSAVKYQKILSWYFIQQRVEYVNQAPVLLAMLMDKKVNSITKNEIEQLIKDEKAKQNPSSKEIRRLQKVSAELKNGDDTYEINAWDAMDNNGMMKPEFATEENVNTWQTAESDQYNEFKDKIDTAIKRIHGDYTTLGAPMESDKQWFRALMMFKRWMIMYVHARVARPQYDSELGREFKGRFMSFDKSSAAAVGTVLGLATFGLNPITPFAIAGGAAIGYGIGSINKYTSDDNVQNKLSFMRGFTHHLTQMLYQSLTNPFKITGSLLAGKNIVPKGKVSDFLYKTERKKDQYDNKNIEANIAEISTMLSYFMLRMVLRFMKNADAEDEDEDEQNHIIYALNVLGNAINDIMTFYDPVGLVETLIEPPVLRTINSLDKAIKALSDYDEVYTTGRDVGKSKLRLAVEKLVPAMFRSELGFQNASRQVYDEFAIEEITTPKAEQSEDIAKQTRTKFKKYFKEKLKDKITDAEMDNFINQLQKQDSTLSNSDAKKLAEKQLDEHFDEKAFEMANDYTPTYNAYIKIYGDKIRTEILNEEPEISEEDYRKEFDDKLQDIIKYYSKNMERGIDRDYAFDDITNK